MVAVGLVLVGAGCAGTPEGTAQPPPVSAALPAFPVPGEVGHVHGLAKDPLDGVLLLAGHSGLFRATSSGFERVGPVVDLMGFTVTGPGHYFASGHPQPGTDLPQPVGLIESTDAGKTWSVRSRGGASDFHALTVAGDAVVGHDGVLRRTDDLEAWSAVGESIEPVSLTGRTGDPRIVGSTATSIVTSADAGRTWSTVPGSPSPALVSRADAAVVAITGEGEIHLSDAQGVAWARSDLRAPGPMAMVASGSTADLEIVVLTEQGLVVSRGGRPFGAWAPNP